MAVPPTLGPVHHLRLTVTDVERSRAFYTELLGFQIAMDTPPPADDPHHDLATDLLQDGIVMVNGDLLLGLRPVDAERAEDRFDPFRCGPGPPKLAVAGRAELRRRRGRSRSAVWSTATSPNCPRSASRCCRSRTPTGSPSNSPPRCSRQSQSPLPSRRLGAQRRSYPARTGPPATAAPASGAAIAGCRTR